MPICWSANYTCHYCCWSSHPLTLPQCSSLLTRASLELHCTVSLLGHAQTGQRVALGLSVSLQQHHPKLVGRQLSCTLCIHWCTLIAHEHTKGLLQADKCCCHLLFITSFHKCSQPSFYWKLILLEILPYNCFTNHHI